MMGPAYLGAGMVLTKLFALVFLLGVVLFVVWAVRALDKKQLKKLVIGLLIVGLAGMLSSAFIMMLTVGKGNNMMGEAGSRWNIGWGNCGDAQVDVEE
jgi:uncharacterized membrane protein